MTRLRSVRAHQLIVFLFGEAVGYTPHHHRIVKATQEGLQTKWGNGDRVFIETSLTPVCTTCPRNSIGYWRRLDVAPYCDSNEIQALDTQARRVIRDGLERVGIQTFRVTVGDLRKPAVLKSIEMAIRHNPELDRRYFKR